MTEWHGWTLSRKETKEWLAECQKRRLKEGKAWKAEARERVAQLESSGREWEAEQTSRTLHRRSVIFARRKRQRQEAELERDMRRVGAAVRKSERDLARVRQYGTAPLFEFEPGRASQRVREGRDLYWEWISRGFGKRKARDYKKSKSPRIRAREAKWKDGEFQDKIVYIERSEALEEVEGNLVSNMGADQAERLGCASRVEEIERLSRKDAGVYIHSILALPADLSPEGRAKLLKELCGNYEKLQIPFCAALHKPDPDNDQRNYHAHILINLRRFTKVGDKWEFAAGKLTWINTPAGLNLQRRIIARAFNKALEAERSSTRWTHRSRAADGLAPRGFTKKGGVRANTELPLGAFEDVHRAEKTLKYAEALDRTVKALQNVATKLESCEAQHQRLKQLSEKSVAASSIERGRRPSNLEVPVTARNSVGPDHASPARVANSQRQREPKIDEGFGRELSPANALNFEEAEATNDAKIEGAEAADKAVPMNVLPEAPPEPRLSDRRRRRLERVRKEWLNSRSFRELSQTMRSELLAKIESLFDPLSEGSVVVTYVGKRLQVSGVDDVSTRAVMTVANSQPGWSALKTFAMAMDDIPASHHRSATGIQEPADDWPPGFDPRGSGYER